MSAADSQKIHEKLDHINGELTTLTARCDAIDSKFGMVWKLQLATLTILVAAVAGGIWFTLTVATRIIFK